MSISVAQQHLIRLIFGLVLTRWPFRGPTGRGTALLEINLKISKRRKLCGV